MKGAGGSFWDIGSSITALSSGSAIITGYFEETAVFGHGEANEAEISSIGEIDVFLAKFAF
ncbi:MAG: hypothetical protein GY847_05215 [Proteobacteria bacterium]|nr:hypothetical protein [Pseudomonadota bacterium]